MASGLCVAAFLLYLLLTLRNAWLSDDAWVSFRVADNLVSGHGLTFNPTERVQAFTNPLWTLLLALPYRLSHAIYGSVIGTSILMSSLAVLLMASRLATTGMVAAFGILLCALSDAFVDYSTSGLENPLTFLLLAVFFFVYFHQHGRYRVFWLWLCAALVGTNRLDTLLLVLPALAYTLLKSSWKLALVQGLLGALPLVAWELFAIVYYGFPLPNTAYAKLNTDITGMQFVQQGFLYLLDSFSRDPVTLLTITFAVVFSFVRSPVRAGAVAPVRKAALGLYRPKGAARRASRAVRPVPSMPRVSSEGESDHVAHDPHRIAAALGIALYVGYVVQVGGDFMAGRMLTGPLFVSVILLVHCLLRTSSVRMLALLAGFTAFVGFGLSVGPWNDQDTACAVTPNGIVNERICYQNHTALVFNLHGDRYKDHPYYRDGVAVAKAGTKVDTKGALGMTGFAAGPGFHLINDYALSEPLLARLRHRSRRGWRIGHLIRALPDGYRRTLETGRNVIADPCLQEYYGHLSLIVRGPVLNWERLRTIVAMNLHEYDELLYPDCAASTTPL